MPNYTKASLVAKLRSIRDRGWIHSARQGNVGGVGNTVEDLLGIQENNLQLPDADEWELKCQRADSASLTTLFHREPQPRSERIVPRILLPKYGWRHAKAGTRYEANEMSFRQTLQATERTDRGFCACVAKAEGKLKISFDAASVDARHGQWLETVRARVGLGELTPQPYWNIEELCNKAASKLGNCVYIEAQSRVVAGLEEFNYAKILMLYGFSREGFMTAIERGHVLVDFDARSGHNHGTKFRVRAAKLPSVYAYADTI